MHGTYRSDLGNCHINLGVAKQATIALILVTKNIALILAMESGDGNCRIDPGDRIWRWGLSH